MKLQKHFVDMYGDDGMAKEKANSFAVGFGTACELICKDLSNVTQRLAAKRCWRFETRILIKQQK